MSREIVGSLIGKRVGVVNNVFEFAPWAEFLAATDRDWWAAHPESYRFQGLKFSGQETCGGVMVALNSTTDMNSGVLAMNCAVQLGARRIFLYGFDMHGSHYFGDYTNGLPNTPPECRRRHDRQYFAWSVMNPEIRVYNRTPGSALTYFPFDLEHLH